MKVWMRASFFILQERLTLCLKGRTGMECKYQLKDGCMRISLPREVDHHYAEQLRKEADLLIGAYRVRRLVFDFAGTEFMDSSGIGMLIGRCRHMGYSGGEVSAEHLNERIQKIFVVSGLRKMIKVTSEPQENGQREKGGGKER